MFKPIPPAPSDLPEDHTFADTSSAKPQGKTPGLGLKRKRAAQVFETPDQATAAFEFEVWNVTMAHEASVIKRALKEKVILRFESPEQARRAMMRLVRCKRQLYKVQNPYVSQISFDLNDCELVVWEMPSLLGFIVEEPNERS